MTTIPRLIVSACLCGHACRYDGSPLSDAPFESLAKQGIAIPVCPEVLGGLSVPRPPCELTGCRVFNNHGLDITEALKKGAFAVLDMAKQHGIEIAVMKERSPSCGTTTIFDGTFSGRLIPGEGITTRILRQNGLTVFSEETAPYSILRATSKAIK